MTLGRLTPAPTVSRLDELVARCAAGGVDASVTIDGTPRPLPPAVDLAAYRIVQEALTNVVRHARTNACEVRIAYRPDGVVVQVDNDAPSAVQPAEPGNGVTGMKERAASLGGTLQAAPRTPRGFRVRAWLPTPTREDGGVRDGETP